jgi:hypothetical protein
LGNFMTEEQLADLFSQHLDTLLEGGSLPENLPPEVADLLTVAQRMSETAPSPRPEFGPALKEALFGPTVSGTGATPPASSVFSSQTIVLVTVGLLIGAVILAVMVSVIILSSIGPDSGTPASTPVPVQTQTTLTPIAPTVTAEPLVTSQATEAISGPTATPVIDILPAITVTIEIIVEPPAIVPGGGGGGGTGSGGGGGGGGGGDDGGDDGGDHNRGHGNDSDHQDEDNPGNGGRK